ncbi:MAG: hypothetical protein AAFO99_15370, partial [Bacteroidota bacterium]
VLLFLIPDTRRVGFLCCTAYIGGVIAANLIGKEPPIPGLLMQVLLWIGMYLEAPEFFRISPLKIR